MKIRRALFGLAVITVLYLLALVWADSKRQVFAELPKLLSVFPSLMALALSSYLLRYLRWRWLLQRAGYRFAWIRGFLAYLAGFAFTATPGKVGELLRIRYFAPYGIPPWQVLAAFVFERAFDLLVVLLLATLAIGDRKVFAFALGFVLLFMSVIAWFATHPAWLLRVAAYCRAWRWQRLARLCMTLRNGLSGCRMWMTAVDVGVALLAGLSAWGLTVGAFVYLLLHLGIALPLLASVAIYPLAMLAGVASMLPGGVGSTEVTIVLLLGVYGVPVALATLAAVGIRFASIWFAVCVGFIAVTLLETLPAKHPHDRTSG